MIGDFIMYYKSDRQLDDDLRDAWILSRVIRIVISKERSRFDNELYVYRRYLSTSNSIEMFDALIGRTPEFALSEYLRNRISILKSNMRQVIKARTTRPKVRRSKVKH